jgi:hypothetical protein
MKISMAQEFQKGDKVTWRNGRSKVAGTIQKKLVNPTTINGRKVLATSDDPRYLIENENTGKITIRKPKALSKKKDLSVSRMAS